MPILADLPQTWTFDDLRRLLPEDTDNDVDWRRFEIIDGALVVSPSADLDHEYVIDQLRIALRPQLPGQLWVVGPAMVDLHPSYRIPDLLVLPQAMPGADPSWFGFPITVSEEAPFSRDALVIHLNERRIATRLLFGGNLLRQPAMRGQNHRVVGDLTRSDVYLADEMFLCGSAAEVAAVNSVDDRSIPCPGDMTLAIAQAYAKAVRGQDDRYKAWVEHVG